MKKLMTVLLGLSFLTATTALVAQDIPQKEAVKKAGEKTAATTKKAGEKTAATAKTAEEKTAETAKKAVAKKKAAPKKAEDKQ